MNTVIFGGLKIPVSVGKTPTTDGSRAQLLICSAKKPSECLNFPWKLLLNGGSLIDTPAGRGSTPRPTGHWMQLRPTTLPWSVPDTWTVTCSPRTKSFEPPRMCQEPTDKCNPLEKTCKSLFALGLRSSGGGLLPRSVQRHCGRNGGET